MRTIAIANRGEIARRLIRTCQERGYVAVALFSDADAGLPFVREADRAVRLGPGPAADSYLHAQRVIEATRRAGADAIHPGYGFLAENADFAQAVTDAGLTWIGPTPDAIGAMGDKAAARRLAQAHGVPTVPGYDGDDDSEATLVQQAARIGFPVLVKAAAGGGGRGMRRVERAEDLPDAIASARREATAAFGSGRLLLERYVQRPRHVEVQVLGDAHGHVIHLGERECSVQRRHQKILEEAPSPAVDDALRSEIGAAAVRVAQAVAYRSAGTVEFLLDPDGQFYFLEMNTRLQVEHPVTEEVTGLDLVALQLHVAEGLPLPLSQGDVVLDGHAIEARVYAEDPNRDYLPSHGTLVRFHLGGPGVRVDAGYAAGDAVGVHYDSLLAKVIVHGRDRAEANRRLRRAMDRAWVPGVVTNLPLLREVVRTPAWQAGDLHTGFLAAHGLPGEPPLNLERGALAATVVGWLDRARPWPAAVAPGWRVEGPGTEIDTWRCGSQEITVSWTTVGTGLSVTAGDTTSSVRVVRRDADALTVEVDGVVSTWRQARHGDTVYTHFGDAEAMVALTPRFPAPVGPEAPAGSCIAPTPGTVAAIHVALGDEVARGDKLATLEAMKMEHVLTAPEPGVVAEIRVEAGQAVDQGAVLLRLDSADG